MDGLLISVDYRFVREVSVALRVIGRLLGSRPDMPPESVAALPERDSDHDLTLSPLSEVNPDIDYDLPAALASSSGAVPQPDPATTEHPFQLSNSILGKLDVSQTVVNWLDWLNTAPCEGDPRAAEINEDVAEGDPRAAELQADSLCDLFRSPGPWSFVQRGPSCQGVVLSSCNSRAIASASFLDAGALHVADTAARKFVYAFYDSLLVGNSINWLVRHSAEIPSPHQESNKFVLLPAAADHSEVLLSLLPTGLCVDWSQVLRCLSGITPIRSLVNIGGGIADLFRTPTQHMLDTQQAPPQPAGPIAATPGTASGKRLIVFDNGAPQGSVCVRCMPDSCPHLKTLLTSPRIIKPGDLPEKCPLVPRHIHLGELDRTNSVRLLRQLCPNVDVESAARTGDLCGHLPLALRVIGRLLGSRPDMTLDMTLERDFDHDLTLSPLSEYAACVQPSVEALAEPLPLRQALTTLSIFIGHFTPEGASALLNEDIEHKLGQILGLLLESKLVEFESTINSCFVHTLIRLYLEKAPLPQQPSLRAEIRLSIAQVMWRAAHHYDPMTKQQAHEQLYTTSPAAIPGTASGHHGGPTPSSPWAAGQAAYALRLFDRERPNIELALDLAGFTPAIFALLQLRRVELDECALGIIIAELIGQTMPSEKPGEVTGGMGVGMVSRAADHEGASDRLNEIEVASFVNPDIDYDLPADLASSTGVVPQPDPATAEPPLQVSNTILGKLDVSQTLEAPVTSSKACFPPSCYLLSPSDQLDAPEDVPPPVSGHTHAESQQHTATATTTASRGPWWGGLGRVVEWFFPAPLPSPSNDMTTSEWLHVVASATAELNTADVTTAKARKQEQEQQHGQEGEAGPEEDNNGAEEETSAPPPAAEDANGRDGKTQQPPAQIGEEGDGSSAGAAAAPAQSADRGFSAIPRELLWNILRHVADEAAVGKIVSQALNDPAEDFYTAAYADALVQEMTRSMPPIAPYCVYGRPS
ncbi:unnamed protein product [Vitrella brassicaformis CCMP3155]|uniref:Uncharacterized protein n=1 Tax=Vitrella brassicaformis (strain CCMP3155) TaxID=1169540 RepID=A0A0G4FN92_VITBC|nr:unnamed protein product [Vitrella brassicaformis CCMP3155]|eukprot:CEM15714.1 unnamed protein product [Vitrella brassicaformis CCMP3155]